MKASGSLAVFAAIFVSISLINARVNDKCHENCDCDDLEVSCRLGKLPLATRDSTFGGYFDPDLTKMYIDNSESETSLNDKTRLEPLTQAMLTYEYLVNLTLKGCYIETINDDAFSDVVGLKYLNLEDNLIKTLTTKTFSGLKGLQTLSLKNNKLDQVPSGSLEPLISVVTLNLHGNRFATIQAGAFPKDALIENLDIGGNPEMKEIPPAVDSLKGLDKLYARDCRIGSLRDKWQDKFSGIIEVDLTNNAIPEITNSHFVGLRELKKLHLGQNSIKYLGASLFPGLIINHLNLSNNEIQSIDPDFIMSAQITEMDLSHNPVGRWDPGVFDHADIRWEIRKLYMANVSLAEIGDLFNGIMRLNVLDLSGNRLETIASDELDDFAGNLKDLLLAGNQLRDITGAFDRMELLETLSLAGNKLRLLDPETKQEMFPLSLLDKLYRLQSFDLSDNLFTHVPKELITDFSRGNLQNTGLKGNPFHCDWQIRPLYDFMRQERQSGRCPSELRDGKNIQDISKVKPQCLRCVTPEKMRGKFIIQLDTDDMKEPPKPIDDPLSTGGIVAILVTLIALLVIIAVVLILLKRRQEKRKQQEMAEVPQLEDGDWDHQADYDDSFDESKSTFSTAAKSVAHESNI